LLLQERDELDERLGRGGVLWSHRAGSAPNESASPLAVGREQQDGAVVDDDLHLALDRARCAVVVLDRLAASGAP